MLYIIHIEWKLDCTKVTPKKVLNSPHASFAWMLCLTVYPHVSPKSLHRNDCPGAEGMRHGLCLSWEHIRTTLELGVNILTCLLHRNLYAGHKWGRSSYLDCITKHISIWYGSSWKLMVSLKWIGQAPAIGKTFNVCLHDTFRLWTNIIKHITVR